MFKFKYLLVNIYEYEIVNRELQNYKLKFKTQNRIVNFWIYNFKSRICRHSRSDLAFRIQKTKY